ncbi:MAG TPA: hypothetical protein ENK91_00885 [Bacteroidetes bacterium]|nr:hypothetical protein [Bacteroidota bacterium]
MKIYLLALWLFFIGLNLKSQTQTEPCSFTNDINVFFDSKNDIDLFFLDQNRKLNNDFSNRDEIIIPLVFHVFNKSNSKYKVNLSDIYEQVDFLNDAFSGTNTDLKNVPDYFKSSIGKTNIRFCIGYKTEDDEKIAGIIFHENNTDYFADQYIEGDNKRKKIKHTFYGGDDAWNSDKYINIWIGEMSYANGTSTFPGISNEYKDEEGIILNSKIFQYNSKSKKILVHEMGHYFGLLHIWGNEGGCNDDDGIDDTPLQNTFYTGCPKGEKYSCNSKDMYMNYMDYTNDYCSLFFTKDQVAYMQNSLYTYRNTLVDAKYLCDNQSDNSNIKDVEVFSSNNRISILKKFDNDLELEYILYDNIGRNLKSGVIKNNQYIVNLDCNGYPSGIYFVFIKSKQEYLTKKLLLINNKLY